MAAVVEDGPGEGGELQVELPPVLQDHLLSAAVVHHEVDLQKDDNRHGDEHDDDNVDDDGDDDDGDGDGHHGD